MMSVGGDDVDAQSADEAEELRLLRESTDDKTQVRRIGGELPEGRVDRDPVPQKDFRPGVVVKLPADVGEPSRRTRREADGARQCDVKLGVLIAVARPGAEHLCGAGNRKADPL